ncbi:uncharacterized protein LOC135332028 [Halichondria panicea]|uniref:uncharacterized protein LOC135332028 n=1 Tax=Halichondria panicea TaxID=6063 RepID=UPI00312BA384
MLMPVYDPLERKRLLGAGEEVETTLSKRPKNDATIQGNAVTPLATPHTTTQSGSSSEKDTSNGDQPIVLTRADINTICESLKTATCNWFDLGLALGMKSNDLSDIEDEYRHNKRRLMEMVGKRLEVTDPEHPMTWPYICECLRRPTVERNDVAEEIEDKYVRTATAVAHSATN